MENSVIKNRIIPGTVRRPTPRVEKSTENLSMCQDAHGRERVIQRIDNFVTKILSRLVPKKIDRSYYERSRKNLYY